MLTDIANFTKPVVDIVAACEKTTEYIAKLCIVH